jgi:uncharacterized protein (DUF934 family)
MRRILRRHEIVADDWRYLDEQSGGDAASGNEQYTAQSSIIIPLAQLRENAAAWKNFPGRLGVRIGPAVPVEDLLNDLPRLSLIAIEFPGPGEGRGYSTAHLLRQRYQFKGEIRAVGAVKRDQLFVMARSGFDTFELAPTEDIETAASAFERYSVAYQPGTVEHPSILRQRFFA